jgi:hypothetical protein
MEVRGTVDDLRDRLAEVADLAAQQARGPGPAVVARRARRRRRLAGGGMALALVGVVSLSALVPQGLRRAADDPGAGRAEALPWRPLEAREWVNTVPDQRPLDPVVAAAEGERAGRPWRLVVHRSEHRPAGGPPGRDVCFVMDWIVVETGLPTMWQAHGTCAPEAQPATVVTAEGPGAREGVVAVFGRAPGGAARVRLVLRGRAPVEAATSDAPPVGRFYVAFVPRVSYLERVVAVDGAGRALGSAPGQGDLSRRLVGGYPPTGPVAVVATGRSSGGRLELVAWPVRDGHCLALEGERGGGSSWCGRDALDPQPHCSESQTLGEPKRVLRLVYGGVPRSARRVEVRAGGERVTVGATDAGTLLGRAFFLAGLPPDTSMRTVRVAAFDAAGARVAVLTLHGCG